ncbi:glycosyltransferase family 4 protein [Arthrobacter sp. NyZ413]|uniref:glycosyltransferase family 4 protein n=1 Tax=Arthrobacter sp. NyZ413 TaxID=3144669 RepID=UPI003BF8F746
MKVALVGSRNFPARHGGLEVVVENVADGLAAREMKVHVFVGELGEDAGNGNRFQVHETRTVKGKYWHTASQILSGLVEIRRLKPDIVNIHGVGPAFPLALSKRAFGDAPTLVTAHGLDWERRKWPAPARWIFRKIAVRSLKNASSVSCVSESVGTELGRMLGCEVQFTPNGFSFHDSSADIDIELPDKYSVVMSRLTPEKNIETIINAYSKEIANTLGPLVVVGGGGGSYSGEYEDQLRRLATGKEIVFVGHQERPSALSILKGASLYLSLSKLEAQPMAVLEAMSLGVPLLLSDIEPHQELCGESARYVSADDQAGLRRALLSPDNEASKRRAVLAQERVAGMTWERSIDLYESWYQSHPS